MRLAKNENGLKRKIVTCKNGRLGSGWFVCTTLAGGTVKQTYCISIQIEYSFCL